MTEAPPRYEARLIHKAEPSDMYGVWDTKTLRWITGSGPAADLAAAEAEAARLNREEGR